MTRYKNIFPLVAGAVLLASCSSSLVTMKTPLGISVDVEEAAKMDTINANEVRISDDFGQTTTIRRFQREQFSDEEIGKAILDSAKAHGIDLKTASPKKIAADGLVGSYVVGDKRIFSGFIAKGTTDGYFMDIAADGSSLDDAISTAGSVKRVK